MQEMGMRQARTHKIGRSNERKLGHSTKYTHPGAQLLVVLTSTSPEPEDNRQSQMRAKSHVSVRHCADHDPCLHIERGKAPNDRRTMAAEEDGEDVFVGDLDLGCVEEDIGAGHTGGNVLIAGLTRKV